MVPMGRYGLNPVYLELYTKHPEVKSIEPWRNVDNSQLRSNEAYVRALKKYASVCSYILNYLDAPEKAEAIYNSYGIELKSRGYTYQYFIWFTELLSIRLDQLKYLKPEVKSGMTKLYSYTTQIIEAALGE